MGGWLSQKVRLGRTELWAGRLGLGASYGAPAAALEDAFEKGCNYFYWGALRNSKMSTAVRNIVSRGKRDHLIVVIQNFRRSPKGIEYSLMRGLKNLGLDYCDVLLLGWQNKIPKPKILEKVEKLRQSGCFRYLGISGHKRTLFPLMADDPRVDLFHLRYNAANRGAEYDVFPYLPENRPGVVAFTATRRMSLVKSKKIPFHERRPTAGDCYRFVLSNPHVDVAITGPSTGVQLKQNLIEVAEGPLSQKDLEWMQRIGDYVYGRIKKIRAVSS